MARKNRIVVSDGIYHITCRTAHKAHLFASPDFKDRMVTWLHGIADFSGVDIIDYVIMDNHFHVFAAIPPVPERYWHGDAGTAPAKPPCAEAFGMRPPECRSPRWMPDFADERPVVTAAGERLSDDAVSVSVANGIPPVSPPRAKVGFSMTDEEMLDRLSRLNSGWSAGAEKIEKKWMRLRESGQGETVEQEKINLCRRMYNLSQFVKTFKERVSAGYRKFVDPEHSGTIWEGRFFSGIVEKEFRSRLLVSAYIDFNPVKAGIVADPASYRWGAWADANSAEDGTRRAHYRAMYCKLFGCGWNEAKARMNSLFSAKMTDAIKGKTEDDLMELMRTSMINEEPSSEHDEKDASFAENIIGQMIKLSLVAMRKGAYISFDGDFASKIALRLPCRFPRPSMKSIIRLSSTWAAIKSLAA